MLLHTIARLRRLPKAVRNHIALGTAASFTGVLVLLWLMAASPSVTALTTPAAAVESQAGAFSMFFDGLRDRMSGFEGVSEIWQETAAEIEAVNKNNPIGEMNTASAPSTAAESSTFEVLAPASIDSPTTSTRVEATPRLAPPVDTARVPVRLATTTRNEWVATSTLE